MAYKSSTYDVTHKKTASLKQKFFCRVQTRRLATWLLPGLYSIPDQRNSCTKPRAFRHFFYWKSPKTAGRQRVNNRDRPIYQADIWVFANISVSAKMANFISLSRCWQKEVATEPPMDLLISKLIAPYHLAWRGSKKGVSLSLNYCHPSSITGKFQVCYANGCGFTSHLCALHFHNRDCLHVSIYVTSFSLLFQNFSNFLFRGCVSGLALRLGLRLGFRFTFCFYYVFTKPTAFSSCVTVTSQEVV